MWISFKSGTQTQAIKKRKDLPSCARLFVRQFTSLRCCFHSLNIFWTVHVCYWELIQLVLLQRESRVLVRPRVVDNRVKEITPGVNLKNSSHWSLKSHNNQHRYAKFCAITKSVNLFISCVPGQFTLTKQAKWRNCKIHLLVTLNRSLKYDIMPEVITKLT